MNVKVGCIQTQLGSPQYWSDFGFFELRSDVLATVKTTTLERSRADAPDQAEFVVSVAPGVVSSGFVGERAEQAWATTLGWVNAVGAETVLLRTPPEFRPTRANRDALSRFVAARIESVGRIAWQAEGLWESQPDDVHGVCADTGLVPVADPLGLDDLDDLPRGDTIYWRLMGRRGLRSGFSDYELDQLMDLLLTRRDGHLCFSAASMLGEARRFARALRLETELAQDTDGNG